MSETTTMAPPQALPQIDTENIFVVVSVAVAGGILALIMMAVLTIKVRSKVKADEFTVEGRKMVKLARIIQEGAKAFLRTEYKYLLMYATGMAITLVLIFTNSPIEGGNKYDGLRYLVCFMGGSTLSATAGWLGMVIATDCNVRTTYAASTGGLNAALDVAFAGGSVMGFTVVGLGVLGLAFFFILMSLEHDYEKGHHISMQRSFQYLTGYGVGASSIALFARVAGGIYTKAADVGADLVGKVEEDLDEDHPNNPAVIADNVGDNVGDVAGMGADLFGSFVGSIIAAGCLADKADPSYTKQLAFPFWIAGSGILASAIGAQFVSCKDGASQTDLLRALSRAVFVASALVLLFTAVIAYVLFGDQQGWNLFGCVAIGLIAGVVIGEATMYFTSFSYAPVQSITSAATTGAGTVLIQGLGIGMFSVMPPAIILVLTIVSCDMLAGAYGLAIASVGMLATLGVTLATDAYGPVADNAGGIAEMCGLPDEVRDITDALDAVGNTTAATGKGFAIGSAVLTALSLLASFKKFAGLKHATNPDGHEVDVADPIVLSGTIIGSMLPFIFAALTMLSVRKAATSIILEVRRQFAENPRLKDPDYEAECDEEGPDYERVISISTQTSIVEMILPGAMVILAPIIVGFMIGPKCLAGMLSGAIGSGFMMAIMMSNAGGAWDNAKKYVELDPGARAKYGGKGTDVHKACVVGDTVGDPFKDTSGPALNILIKLMSMISLMFAPLMDGRDFHYWYIGAGVLVFFTALCVVMFYKSWSGFEEKISAQLALIDEAKSEPLLSSQSNYVGLTGSTNN